MKTNHIKFFLIALLGCTVLSCSADFLDREQQGVLDEGTYLNTADAGYKLLINCYTPILDDWNYQVSKFEIGETLADNTMKGGSDVADRVMVTEISRGNPTTTNGILYDYWNHRYRTAISACNVFLSIITPETELIDANGAIVPTETKKRWIAEAHFLRAFYYFDLAIVFANVPIIDKVLTAEDKNNIVKSDRTEVLNFIISDLDTAISEENLISAKDLPDSEIGRVTKEAALSFRARVKMFYNDYEGAKKDLAIVVNSGCYELVDDYQNLFNSFEKGYLSKESVFITLRSYIPNYTGGSVCPQMNIGRNAAGGWGGQVPSNDLVEEYEVGDPRLTHTVISSGDIFYKDDGVTTEVHDYSGYDNYTLQHIRKQWIDYSRRPTGNLLETDWTFYHIRYADVLLMYAECLIETGDNKQLAVDLINEVRRRAFVTTSPTDKFAQYRKFNIEEKDRVSEEIFEQKYKVKISDDLRKAVRHERRVELACEGLRLYDLLRWGIFVQTMQEFGKSPEGKYSGTGTLVTEKTWPYPIPQNEIDYVGGSLTQNENY